MGGFEDGGAVVKDGAVGLFEGDQDGDFGLSSKGAASEGGGPESRIENGGQFWGGQQRSGDHGANPAESAGIPASVGAFGFWVAGSVPPIYTKGDTLYYSRRAPLANELGSK